MASTKTESVNSRIYGMAYSASKDWFRRQCANPAERMYFYYKPGEIAFYIGAEPLNNQWVLAMNDRISTGRTQEQICIQLQQIARQLPILS